MYSKTVTVVNKTGLHARPGAAFVAAAGKFESGVTVRKLDDKGNALKEGNAKSIVMLLSMALGKGSTIEIAADGQDEQQAVDTLAGLVESGLGE